MKTHLLADRYLQGTLDEDEVEAFEERLVWDSELVEELELARQLRDGMRAVYADEREEVIRPAWRRRLGSILESPRYAAAASFILGIGLASSIPMGTLQQASDAFEAPVTQVARLEVVRNGTGPQIAIDKDAIVVLLVEPPYTAFQANYTSFRVSIATDVAGAEPHWTRSGLELTYEDSLAITIPGRDLPEGAYLMRIEGATLADDGGTSFVHVQDLPFRAEPVQ